MAVASEHEGDPAGLHNRGGQVDRHRRNRRLFAYIGAVLALLALIAGVLHSAGYRLNRTASYPLGIYQLTGESATVGDLALFCPPLIPAVRMARARGYIPFGICAGGTAPLIKRLVAAGGDVVSVGAAIRINDRLQPNSRRLTMDQAGLPLPTPEGGVLVEGQVWLMSDYAPRSFDSRYFGAVPEAVLIGAIAPIWTWGAS